jgi:tetratricopeptide (TPR) repeat protein
MSVEKPKPANRPQGRLPLVAGKARAWLSASPARQYAAAAVALTLFVAATFVFVRAQMLSRARQKPVERPTLKLALAALDRELYPEARLLVEQIDRTRLKETELGGPDFVLGIVAAREADELWAEEKKNYSLIAAKHLAVAREKGFERALDPAGSLLFGKSLFQAGRVAECREVLEGALEALPQHATLIHQLLAVAWRRAPERDLAKALEHNRRFLADPELPISDRDNGLLRSAQLLWGLKDYDACAQALDAVPAESFSRPEAELLRGRLALRMARQLKEQLPEGSPDADRQAVKEQYARAIKTLRRAQDDPLGDLAIRRSMYLIGVCLMEMGDAKAALAQFERTRDVYLGTPEGLAAGLQEADLLLSKGREEQALAAYRRTLGAVKDTGKFTNRWIPSDKFRARILAAYQHYIDTEQYERAIELTARLAPLFPQAQGIRLTAETYRTWARNLLQTAENLPDPQGLETRKKSRALYRQAGKEFSQLGELEFTTRNYPDIVWQAAECYLAGHQFTQAVASLEEYLKYELRRRRPLALMHMGEALLALGRVDDALEALTECIEFYPHDAASFRSRLWAARANAEKGDAATAEALLRENLNGELLTPDSKEWRDSLFALGKLLAAGDRHVDAIESLEEAVARYPDTRQAIEARYLIAVACQQAADGPQEKAATDSVETARIAHLKQAQQFLETAIRYYEETQQVLNRRQEQTELSSLEKSILRNSYFAVGAALVELGRYEDAIRAYSTATNRYQHDPEVLEAFTQIAACYRRLNKPREARGAVAQAKVVFERIKPNASFADVSIYSRKEWKDLLDWLSKL